MFKPIIFPIAIALFVLPAKADDNVWVKPKTEEKKTEKTQGPYTLTDIPTKQLCGKFDEVTDYLENKGYEPLIFGEGQDHTKTLVLINKEDKKFLVVTSSKVSNPKEMADAKVCNVVYGMDFNINEDAYAKILGALVGKKT